MILARRKAHFYAAILLASTLPILFVAALLWRPAHPTATTATDPLFAAANFLGDNSKPSLPDRTSQLSDGKIEVRAEVLPISEELMVLEVQPQILQFSDVLVYWQAGDQPFPQAVEKKIQDSNLLLGQLSGPSLRRFKLPTEIQNQKGQLILYSRGQDTLIAAFPFTLAPSQP